MTIAVLVEQGPPAPPPPINPGWERATCTWRGWDDSVWRLTDPESGVFIVNGGIRGMGLPPIKHYRDDSPAVYGSRYRGTTYDTRPVFWPLFLYSDTSTAHWVALDRAFWHSLHPEHEGLWTVEIPGISKRTLRLRVEDDSDWAPESDPTFFGWTKYGVNLKADQPLWEGEPVSRLFESDDPAPFFGGLTPGAPIISIGSSRAISSASINNPGDVEAWATWQVLGPIGTNGASIVVDGHSTVIPFEIASGDRLVLDTRPTEQTANLIHADGSIDDVFADLESYDPVPIQAGDQANLQLELGDNTGSIHVSLTPLYLRAW